jgi:hypothetical protein
MTPVDANEEFRLKELMERKSGHSLLLFVIVSLGLTNSLAATNTQIVDIPTLLSGSI